MTRLPLILILGLEANKIRVTVVSTMWKSGIVLLHVQVYYIHADMSQKEQAT